MIKGKIRRRIMKKQDSIKKVLRKETKKRRTKRLERKNMKNKRKEREDSRRLSQKTKPIVNGREDFKQKKYQRKSTLRPSNLNYQRHQTTETILLEGKTNKQ